MLYDGNNAYSPLLCIAKNIAVEGGLSSMGICVSPAGKIAVVTKKPSGNAALFQETINRTVKAIRTWSHLTLDKLSADRTYREWGQAYDVNDLMSKNGYLTYAEADAFNADVDKALVNDDVLIVLICDDPAAVKQDLAELPRDNGYVFTVVDENVGKSFLA